MNSVGTLYKPGEAVGAICRLTHPSKRTLFIASLNIYSSIPKSTGCGMPATEVLRCFKSIVSQPFLARCGCGICGAVCAMSSHDFPRCGCQGILTRPRLHLAGFLWWPIITCGPAVHSEAAYNSTALVLCQLRPAIGDVQMFGKFTLCSVPCWLALCLYFPNFTTSSLCLWAPNLKITLFMFVKNPCVLAPSLVQSTKRLPSTQ